MKKTRRPVVLTVNGKAEIVVQDAESYQQILDRLDRFEAVEAIRLGIAAAEEGRVKPALVNAEEDHVRFICDVRKEPSAAVRWFRGLVQAIHSLEELPSFALTVRRTESSSSVSITGRGRGLLRVTFLNKLQN